MQTFPAVPECLLSKPPTITTHTVPALKPYTCLFQLAVQPNLCHNFIPSGSADAWPSEKALLPASSECIILSCFLFPLFSFFKTRKTQNHHDVDWVSRQSRHGYPCPAESCESSRFLSLCMKQKLMAFAFFSSTCFTQQPACFNTGGM